MKAELFEQLLKSVREGCEILRGHRKASREFAAWDREIEAHVKAGRLEELAERALQEHKAGRSTDL